MSAAPRNLRLLLALCLPVLPLVAAYWVFFPLYQTSDDAGTLLTAQGIAFTSAPDPHLLFTNILLGELLAFAYELAPGVAWYDWMLLSVQLIAGMTIAWVVLSRRASATRILLLVVYFAVFDLLFYFRPNFTIPATLLAQAAVVVWLERIAVPRRLAAAPVCAFLSLLVVAGLIRFESAALAIALAGPLIAVQLFLWWRTGPASGGRRFADAFRAVLILGTPFLVGGALLLGLRAYDEDRYARDPAWADYQASELAIVEFIDYERAPYTPETKSIFDDVGWSSNDYAMLLRYFFFDREVYSAEKMQRILDRFPDVRMEESWIIQERLRMRYSPELLLMLAAMVVPTLFVRRGQGRIATLALLVATLLTLSAYLVLVLHRFPARVYEPMFAFVACIGIVLADRDLRPPNGRTRSGRAAGWLPALALAGVFALLPGYLWRLHERSAFNGQLSASLDDAMAEIQPYADQLYVVWGAAFPWELVPPLSDFRRFSEFRVLAIDTGSQSPMNAARLEEHGIDDLYLAIVQRDDVFLVSRGKDNFRLTQYLYEHYGVIAGYEQIVDFEMLGTHYGFAVYRFFDANPALHNLGELQHDPMRLRGQLDDYLLALQAWPTLAAGYRALGIPMNADGAPDLRDVDPAELHWKIGEVYARGAMIRQAEHHFHAASEIAPENGRYRLRRAAMLNAQARTAEALPLYRAAIESGEPLAPIALAWVLATNPDPKIRDGDEALRLASQTAALKNIHRAFALDALAAAQAETGDYAAARITALQAIEAARHRGRGGQAAEIEARLRLYRADQPYRETSLAEP